MIDKNIYNAIIQSFYRILTVAKLFYFVNSVLKELA